MHEIEKALSKATRKIAKWNKDKCSYQVLPNGFILKMHGDATMLPTIGVVDDQLIGAQDDFDMFLDMLGYEGQVERVLFDPSKVKFILDAGWSGKYWRKPTPKQTLTDTQGERADFVVDTIPVRLPSKISAIALILIAASQQSSRRKIKEALNPFRKKN